MAIRKHTEVRDDGVIYEIFDNEVLVWSRYPKFGKNAHNRAGGTLFIKTAREQDAYADKLRKGHEGKNHAA